MTEPLRRCKPGVNWSALKADWRTGNYTNRALGRNYGVDEKAIRKRAIAENWTRDLEGKVQEKVQAMLTSAIGPHGPHLQRTGDETRTDEQIVDEVARGTVDVILGHRKDIREQRALCTVLLDELRAHTFSRDELEAAIEIVFNGKHDGQMRSILKRMVALPARAGVARDLANATRHLVSLERQAFGMAGLRSSADGGDPVQKHRADESAGSGKTAEERARAIIALVEKASRAKQTQQQPGLPGTRH